MLLEWATRNLDPVFLSMLRMDASIVRLVVTDSALSLFVNEQFVKSSRIVHVDPEDFLGAAGRLGWNAERRYR